MLREQDICRNLQDILDELLDDLEYLSNLVNDLTEKSGCSFLGKKIKDLCNLDFYTFFPPTNPDSYSETQKESFFLKKKHFIIGLLWTLKSQTKAFRKSEYPYNHPYFRVWEPFGNQINSELELWYGCLDFIDTYGYQLLSHHKTAVNAFYWTTYENILGCCKITQKTITKEDLLKSYLAEIKQLDSGENIYSPDEPDEENLYNLINLAINIKKRNFKDSNALKKARTKFINSYWNPYIEGHKECYKTYKTTKEFKMTCIKDNKLKIILSGRQMLTLFPLTANSLKVNRRKKMLITSPG